MTRPHELEYGRPPGPTAPRSAGPRIRYVRIAYRLREFEAELFDPAPPPAGAVLLTGFSFGGATLSAAHRRTIARLAATIVSRMPRGELECIFIRVTGHEDELGDPVRYGQLGEQRARAVAVALGTRIAELVRRMPAATRPRSTLTLEVTSAGPTQPIRSNATSQGRA